MGPLFNKHMQVVKECLWLALRRLQSDALLVILKSRLGYVPKLVTRSHCSPSTAKPHTQSHPSLRAQSEPALSTVLTLVKPLHNRPCSRPPLLPPLGHRTQSCLSPQSPKQRPSGIFTDWLRSGIGTPPSAHCVELCGASLSMAQAGSGCQA